MPNCCDAEFLKSLVRQARKNRLVYLVLAERRLVTFKAEAAQPTPEVHLERPRADLEYPGRPHSFYTLPLPQSAELKPEGLRRGARGFTLAAVGKWLMCRRGRQAVS
jgi:hypothetical protein